MKSLLCSIAVIFALSASVQAVDVGVSVPGIVDSGRGESLENRRSYERLERNVRSIRMAQRHLERLSRQETPDKLDAAVREEWLQQSEWLAKQADRLDDLVGELGRYLGELSPGPRQVGHFDYQRIRMETALVLDGMKDRAEKYTVAGKAAARRQEKAIKIIAHAD